MLSVVKAIVAGKPPEVALYDPHPCIGRNTEAFVAAGVEPKARTSGCTPTEVCNMLKDTPIAFAAVRETITPSQYRPGAIVRFAGNPTTRPLFRLFAAYVPAAATLVATCEVEWLVASDSPM